MMPPPVPPNPNPIRRHWSNTFWFGGIVTALPAALLIALALLLP